MTALHRYVTSSVGSKQLMGITGLGMCGFLVTHLAGNLLIFAGPDVYNHYSYALVSNPLIYLAEAGLVAIFIVHVIKGVVITRQNRASRPVNYLVDTNGFKKTTFVSRTLMAQGLVIFAFVILHLAHFKYGHDYKTTVNGVEMRDLYKTVLEIFHEPGYVAWYAFALMVLGLHMGHGFYSSFQSLGLNNPKVMGVIRKVGYVYDVVVTVGFLSLPFYVYFRA